MDILDSYQEYRTKLIEISRNIFELLQSNDTLGLIKSRGLIRIDIRPTSNNALFCTLDFYSAKDEVPIFSLDFDRVSVMEFNQEMLIEKWLEESLLLIEKHNIHICKRFLKDFSLFDHKTILCLISNYDKFGTKSNDEISKHVAKFITANYLKAIEGLKNEKS